MKKMPRKIHCRLRNERSWLCVHALRLLSWGVVMIACVSTRSDAACTMTQDCTHSNNEMDAVCIPKAHREPVEPQPMAGEGWARATGGGACNSTNDCHSKGVCSDGKCVCHDDGVTAGSHCEDFAIQCPEYKDSACCSWQQNRNIADNFKLIASLFGRNSKGGCDACAANIMLMWCGIVCSPNQASFLHLHGDYPSINYRPDPLNDEKKTKVLQMNLTLSTEFTCGLFSSCKNTALASVSDAMKSSLGFLKYQAQTGAISHGEYFFLNFDNTSVADSFQHRSLKCSNYSDVDTYKNSLPAQAQILQSILVSGVRQCPCGSCKDSCDPQSQSSFHIHTEANPISKLAGFHGLLVSICYAVGAVLTGVYWLTTQR